MVADNVRRPFLGVPGSPQLTTASERDTLSQSVTISSTFVCMVCVCGKDKGKYSVELMLAALKCRNVDTTLKCRNVNTTLKCRNVNTALNNRNVNTALKWSNVNTALKCRNVNTALKWSNVNTAFKGIRKTNTQLKLS